MDGLINPAKSGLLLALFFSLFAPGPTKGQTAEKSIIIPPYQKQKLLELRERFLEEDEINEQQLKSMRAAPYSKTTDKDGNSSALMKVTKNGTRIYYSTYAAPASFRSVNNNFDQYGAIDLNLSGYGMKAGVWDAGKALETHQEFNSRIDNTDFDSEIDSHSTMVTGIIGSSGINERAKGIAFESEVVSNDWKSDRAEVINEIQNGMLVSNHSYGIRTDNVPDWYFGAYLPISRHWDEIMYNAPYYLMVSAAGNAQSTEHNESPIYGKSSDGFDLLVGFTTSKNGLVVTGADTQFDNQGELENVEITGYSSFGPIDDGRIKPDIAGNGNLIYSARSSSDSSYGSSMGTSMAAPGVTGGLLLLQELHHDLFGSPMKAATLKGLTLHTATDVLEPGPDYKLGWGVFNVEAGAKLLEEKDFSSMLVEERLEQSETVTYKIVSGGNGPLKVSISWTDPEGELSQSGALNSAAPKLVNDLDIRIEKDGELFYPYKLNPIEASAAAITGDNLVDPFERIDIENATGEYVITISHKGNLKFSSQDFTLLVSGAEFNPCSLEIPTGLELNKATELGCGFVWDTSPETPFEVQYKKPEDNLWISDYTLKSNYFITGLEYGKIFQFRVRTVCSENLESDFSEIKEFIFEGEETRLLEYEINGERAELKLYPNPTIDLINLGEALDERSHFKVMDLAGNIRKQGQVLGPVSVSDLNTGLYIVTITNQKSTKSAKFFKN